MLAETLASMTPFASSVGIQSYWLPRYRSRAMANVPSPNHHRGIALIVEGDGVDLEFTTTQRAVVVVDLGADRRAGSSPAMGPTSPHSLHRSAT